MFDFSRAVRRALFAAALTAVLAWGAFGPGPLAADEGREVLVIVHTSDVHGYGREERDPKSGRLTRLGYPRLKAFFQTLPGGRKMLVDAGDLLHGQPLATVGRGRYVARILQEMNYDALAAGNHDFDYGLGRLLELRDEFGLNFLAANIVEKEDGLPPLPPCLVRDFGGLKVGLFALTTPDTPLKTGPGLVESLSFGRPSEVLELARTLTDRLRQEEGAELVVALTHLGTGPLDRPAAQQLARAVPGLDLIIDGHSHRAQAGLTVDGTLIVSAGAYLENVGLVSVRRLADGRLSLDSKLTAAADLEEIQPDPALAALIDELTTDLNRDLSRTAGRAPFDLDGRRASVRHGSAGLGRLLCAAIKSATEADAAIFNGGSIRDSIPAGDFSYQQLLAALPYANYALTLRLTGAELLEALNHGLAQPGEGGFPQFYGLQVTAREVRTRTPDGRDLVRNRAIGVEIGGRQLDLTAEYTIAVNDFMYAGGDGYPVFAGRPARTYGQVTEMLRKFLSSSDPEMLAAVNQAEPLTIIVEEDPAP